MNFEYTKVLVSAAYNVRIEDLQPDYRIHTTCYKCGCEGFVDPVWLLKRHKPYVRVVVLSDNFKCASCNTKGKNMVGWEIVKISF